MARPSLSDLWAHRLSRRMLLLRSRGIARRRGRGAARRGAVRRRGAASALQPGGGFPTQPGGGSPSSPAAAPPSSPAATLSSASATAPSSSSPSYTPYVALSVYVAKGHLLYRHGYKETQELIQRGKDVDDFCIHYISPVPKNVGFRYLKRDFSLKDDSMLEEIKRDWYAVVAPKIKDPEKKTMDQDLFFVNGELQKHARTIPQFNNGEEAVRFCLDKFRELDVRNKLHSLGNISGMVYGDKNGSQWRGLLRDDLKRRLLSLFTIAPRLRVFKTQQHIFVHEFEFFFNVETGALVNPDVVLPNDSRWLYIMWGEKTELDAKTVIYV